jgi:hypothetical protein
MEKLNQMKTVQLAAEIAYMEKGGLSEHDAQTAASGYVDAIDDVVEAICYLLRITGPIEGTLWTTKKEHQLKAQVWTDG